MDRKIIDDLIEDDASFDDIIKYVSAEAERLEYWLEFHASIDDIKEYLLKHPEDLSYIFTSSPKTVLVKLLPTMTATQLLEVINHDDYKCFFALREELFESIENVSDDDNTTQKDLFKAFCERLIFCCYGR